MNKRMFIYALTVVDVIIALSLVAFLPIFQFPNPTGPHGVGQASYHWTDEQRKEMNADDASHPNRELMAYIWYPTEKIKPKSYLPYDRDGMTSAQENLSNLSGMPRWLFSGLGLMKISAQLNAPLLPSASRYPIVVVSHGFGAMLQNYTWFCEHLASNGFFVIGINHPYVAGITRFPDRVITTLVHTRKKEAVNPEGKERYRAWKEEQVQTCAADVSFVIDKLKKLAEQGTEFWSSAIDLEHVGVMGHSFGGSVTVRACHSDSRITCGIDMDGGLRGADVGASIVQPFLFLLGEKSNQWRGEDVKDLQAIMTLSAMPGTTVSTVTIKDAGHAAFSDMPLQSNASFFTRMLAGRFGLELPAPQACDAMKLAGDYVLDFFDNHLKGKPSTLLPQQPSNLMVAGKS